MRRVSVSVPVAVWGVEFSGFAEEWFASVNALNRLPDEIVLGVEQYDLTGASEASSVSLIPIRFVVLPNGGDFNDYWNAVFDACSGDWIAPCCIDDRFLPEALDEIDQADSEGAELLVDGIKWKYRGGDWRGYWDPAAIGRVLTLPGAAPFRRSLYDRIGGFRRDVRWSDWAFYMDAAAAGAKTYQASTLRIVFDEGNAHPTRSGVRLDADTRRAADDQIIALARELGLR